MAASALLHAACLLLLFAIAPLLARVRLPVEAPVRFEWERYDVVYLPPGSLPNMEDASGARAGRAGRSGGREAFHPTQTIRVAQDERWSESVAIAPKLSLPRVHEPVANLLALSSGNLPAGPTMPVRHEPASARAEAPAPEPPAGVPDPPPPTKVQVSQAEVQVPPPPPMLERAELPVISLPEPTIVPPPPANVARELANLRPWNLGDPHSVAPPAAPAAAEAKQAGAPEAPNGGVPGGTAEALVVSVHSGEKLGLPADAAGGSLAMSPHGGTGPGPGGAGGGTGIGSGDGPGSGRSGSGPGGATAGTGPGASTTATAGTTPGPGPGGTGRGNGRGGIAGVTIRGGVINLPSFGAAAGNVGANPRAPLGPRKSPGVTIVASPRSGGALDAYGFLKGAKVYTVYLETKLGTLVLQYADTGSGHRSGFEADLTAPELLQADAPAGSVAARFVAACTIDRDGLIRNLRVIDSATGEVASRMADALRNWRFRPVLRQGDAVEVQALLGLNVRLH